jgi:Ner family transcriptional regulator
MQSPADWHPEDVKAAIRKTGTTMEALGLSAGFSRVVVGIALRRPMPRIEALIARHLGVAPQTIWPSRYDAEGNPKRGLYAVTHQNRSAAVPTPHRQKSEAA